MKNRDRENRDREIITMNDNEEEFYVASECICDDDGIHYICSKCGKYHDTDLDAVMCCLIDESRRFIQEFNKNKVTDEFLSSCKKAGRLFEKNH